MLGHVSSGLCTLLACAWSDEAQNIKCQKNEKKKRLLSMMHALQALVMGCSTKAALKERGLIFNTFSLLFLADSLLSRL